MPEISIKYKTKANYNLMAHLLQCFRKFAFDDPFTLSSYTHA